MKRTLLKKGTKLHYSLRLGWSFQGYLFCTFSLLPPKGACSTFKVLFLKLRLILKV